jgi:DNA-binding LacI/PurR family transcriptional regulator
VQRGLLSASQGKKITRTDISPALRDAGNVATSSFESFYQKIKKAVREGAYLPGERLPKFDSFVAADHISRATIARALSRLSQEMLIHKRGAAWIAGPRPAIAAPMVAASPTELCPTMLLLFTDAYQNIFHNTFLMPFLESMESTLREKGVRLTVGHRIKSDSGRSYLPNQGIAEIQETIRKWGDYYRGAVIIDQHSDADTMRSCAAMLSCSNRRPVIFFDAGNDRTLFTRSELSLGPSYFRMHQDDASAVALAVSHLSNAGHNIIGVPMVRAWESAAWVKRRTALIRECARKRSMEIIAATHSEPFWDISGGLTDPAHLGDCYSRILRHAGSNDAGRPVRPAPSSEDVLRNSPSMADLMRRGITAIIALNDWLAHQHFIWCHAAGLRVPRQISIISFDNDPITRVFPISTVDFGFSRLGYLAARILCGAESPHADRDGNVPGVCTVVNRGSVGPAGSSSVA